LGAGIFYTNNFNIDNSGSLSWNLGSNIEVFDAELFAIEKAFKIAFEKITKFTKNIWIFSDSQAAIERLQNSSLKPGQKYVIAIKNWIAKIKTKKQININLNWVPAHMNIHGNEYADSAAKKGAELKKISLEKYVSLAFIKRKIKESSLNEWQQKHAEIKKGKHYNQFESRPKWKAYSKILKKQIWSAFMQLKLGHGYFRSYLIRFPDYLSNRCFTCGTKENPEHLILHCKNTKFIREELKKEFNIKEFSLKNLFNIKIGQEFLFKFIEKTQIGTRQWLLQTANYESNDEE
jgi:ribonuclease HI